MIEDVEGGEGGQVHDHAEGSASPGEGSETTGSTHPGDDAAEAPAQPETEAEEGDEAAEGGDADLAGDDEERPAAEEA